MTISLSYSIYLAFQRMINVVRVEPPASLNNDKQIPLFFGELQ